MRQMGAEFAKRYPKIGARLLLEEDKCEDPHVERLIEAFAFLSARIHKKIEDEFPEVTTSLLKALLKIFFIRPQKTRFSMAWEICSASKGLARNSKR